MTTTTRNNTAAQLADAIKATAWDMTTGKDVEVILGVRYDLTTQSGWECLELVDITTGRGLTDNGPSHLTLLADDLEGDRTQPFITQPENDLEVESEIAWQVFGHYTGAAIDPDDGLFSLSDKDPYPTFGPSSDAPVLTDCFESPSYWWERIRPTDDVDIQAWIDDHTDVTDEDIEDEDDTDPICTLDLASPEQVADLYESDGLLPDLYDADAIADRINRRLIRAVENECTGVTVEDDGTVYGDRSQWEASDITRVTDALWDDHDMPYDLIYRDLDAAALRDILTDDRTATGYGLWQVCDTAQHSTILDSDTRDALKALKEGALHDQDWQGAPTMDADTVDTIRRTMLQLLSPAGAVIAPALDPSAGRMTTVVLAAAWVEDEGALTYTLVDAITSSPLHHAGRTYVLVDDLEDADQTDPISPAGDGDIDHADESEARFDAAVHELTGYHLGAYDDARGIQWLTRRAAR